jgi:hypothetical protein
VITVKKNSLRILIATIFTLPLLAVCSKESAPVAGFSADLKMETVGRNLTGRIYVSGQKYRMELNDMGHLFFVIVNQETDTVTAYLPSEKVYVQVPTGNDLSLMNDPVQAARHVDTLGERIPMGTEKVNGYNCAKTLIRLNGNDLVTKWESRELNFPLKIVGHVNQIGSIELFNIKDEPVSDTLFEHPSGYKTASRSFGPPGP